MTTNDLNTPAHDHQPATLCSVRKAGGMGSLLRSLAGTPAGWRPTRRGSFLVLVVGTLALLAVMAIIYSSIGNHDVRMNAAIAKHERLDEAPEQIKNYLLSIIGDSVTQTYYDTKEGVPNGEPVYLSRVTFDYPSTTYVASSTNLNLTNTSVPFSPTGSVTGFLATPDFSQRAASAMPDKWQPSTPWLAASEPTFLNYQQINPPPVAQHWFKRDWAHISNISPDGRFINLHNFRDNFAAESGFLASGNNGKPQTSYRVNQTFDPVTGATSTATDFGQNIDPLNPLPAHLDSRQAWMFRPARASGVWGPDQPSYEPYLYADADGDGMFDSRWQELVDARAGILKNYLNVDPRFRYAVAVRITDLSGNINVNTATDSKTVAATVGPTSYQAGPRPYAPVGMSPADVDLHRLLSGQLPFEMAGPGMTAGFGLDAIPGSTTGSATVLASDYGNLDQAESFAVGDSAYQALRLRLASGVTPPADIRFAGATLVTEFTNEINVAQDLFDFANAPEARWTYYSATGRALQSASFDKANAQTVFQGEFGLDDLAELVTRRAVNDPSVTSSLELTLGGRGDPPPPGGNLPDRHSPLRSNRGLDVELKRYVWPPVYTVGSEFDQTMVLFNADSRGRVTPVNGARQFRQAPSYEAPSGRTIDPYALGTSELRVDPKLYLPTIRNIDEIMATPAATPPTSATLAPRHAATNTIFRTFVDALAPRLGVGDSWAANRTAADPYLPRATEFYGYRGPELALRIAAHMTVNLIDAFDKRTGNDNPELPTVHTLLLDRDFPTVIQNLGANTPEGRALGPWKDVTLTGNQLHALQLPGELLASPAGGHVIGAPVVNVFGVEAQPFITQVASFTVYADKKRLTAAEDQENDPGPPGAARATIQSDISFGPTGNPDLMYRGVAFQLHNPFDSAITLSSQLRPDMKYYNARDNNFPRVDIEQTYFYINFNGHTFKLAALEEPVYESVPVANQMRANHEPAMGHDDSEMIFGMTPTPGVPTPHGTTSPSGSTRGVDIYVPGNPITLSPITIAAGETIVVYALSDTPKQIAERMSGLSGTPGTAGAAGNFLNESPGGTTRQWKEFRSVVLEAIQGNMGDLTPGIKAYWIPEIETTSGPNIGKAVIPSHDSTNDYVSATAGGGTETVYLWRALRSGEDAQTTPLRNLPNQYWATGVGPRPGGPAVFAYVPNLPDNDQLVDRFVIGDMGDFDAKLDTTNLQHHIDSSTPTDDSKLFMLTKWAAVARRANPGGAAPIGALPAFCLEPKYATNWNTLRAGGLNDPLDEGNFVTPTFQGAAENVSSWLLRMATVAMDTNTIAKGPQDLNDAFPTANVFGTMAYNTTYPELALPENNMKVALPPPPPPPAPPGPPDRVLLRPADLLLPLGIGPEEVPVDSMGALVTDMNERWTTLGEAMALALGYQTNAALPSDSMSAVFAPVAGDPLEFWPLDRGNLRLDAFAPFIDINSDGAFTANSDVRVGLQIPMALNILDAFTTSPVDLEAASWETLKRATPGTVNINTVSAMTLAAAFPMLTPPPFADPMGNPLWWWGSHNGTADVASSVVAYRDRLEVMPRSATATLLPAPGTVNFNVNSAGGGLDDPAAPDDQLTGRYESSGIAGIHEYPGFRSIGELLSVRYQPPGATTNYPTSMDYLARDTSPASPGFTPPASVTYPPGASGRIGVDSVTYTNPSPTAGAPPKIPSNIQNSYKEQLALINSVLPSVSTRSDYFCVWFLVHGYQKSDCEGLGVDDPLVPSIARRFVMVVDRSKVTKKGDLPEVLLFKEVPVDPAPR